MTKEQLEEGSSNSVGALQRLQDEGNAADDKPPMQKTLSSTQLKEMLASDSNPYQNHEDITLNMSGENKNDQELNAEIIEKYFAENSGSNTDPSSGEKYVDDDDFDDTHQEQDKEDQPFYESVNEQPNNPYENQM